MKSAAYDSENERDYYWAAPPTYGNLAPRISSRAAKRSLTRVMGRAAENGVPRFSDAMQRLGREVVENAGSLFQMYERIAGEIRTRCRCAFIPHLITRWAACG